MVLLTTYGLQLTTAFADALTVRAEVDKSELRLGETLVFSVTLSGPIREAPNLRLPSLEGFHVVSSGQSHQMELKGGQATQALTFSFVLVPTAPGTHTLGPVQVEFEGQTHQTQPIEVKVEKAPEAGPEPAGRPKLEGGVVL